MSQSFFYLLAMIILLLVIFLLQGAHSALCSQTDQCHNETLNPDCHKSLPLNISNNTTVSLCNGQIDIENDTVISNVTDIHLTSFGDGRTELVCTRSAVGFNFSNVVNLQISSIVFDGCGLIYSYKEIDNSTLLITGGLVITHCKNVVLNDVTVQNSIGSGLILNQTSGEILIKKSSFDGNCKDESVLALAGGLYIEFAHENNNYSSEVATTYFIDDCEFVNNQCGVPSFTDGLGSATKYEGYGKGGGMRLVYNHNVSNSNVSIINSTFSNNSALWGGGFCVHYKDSPNHNWVVVQNSRYFRNKSFYNGGGIEIRFAAHYSQTSTSLARNNFEFQNSIVVENLAGQYGGGLSIFSSRNKFIALKLSFSECSFSNNKALYGPAVDMLPHTEEIFNDGYLSSISFSDCDFNSNTITKKLIDDSMHNTFKHYESGKGVFACTSFSLFISGRTIFNYNQGSAMHLSSCKIQFESGSQVSFTNNSGYDGGAIVLFGASVLYVDDNSTFLFFCNTAVRRGGAIMYFSNNEHDFISLKSCFIQYLGQTLNVGKRMIQLNFTDNKAEYGQAIFASTLRPCQRLCIQKQVGNWTISKHTSIKESFGCIGDFILSNETNNSVSTSGEMLVSDSTSTGSEVILATPGQELWLEFNMNDELSQSTYDTFHVSIEGKTSGEANISIDPAYTYVEERKVVKLYGRPGENAKLVLTNAEFQPITVIASVRMKHCPPGFVLSESTNEMTCVCSAETENKRYIGITSCSSQKKVAYILRGYWVGYKSMNRNEDELVTGKCPKGFCVYKKHSSTSLLNKYELLTDASVFKLDSYICGDERTGKLCGRCRPNHSVFFHSRNYQCRVNDHTCKVSTLLYFISELLPVTVLFLIVIIFDIHFTSGSLNSLLFYVQMIDALVIDVKGIIQPHPVVNVFVKANQLIYGVFNLKFFTSDIDALSFCMWSTASTLDILAFKYVTITYSLLLIIVTVVLMKFCNPRIIRKLFPYNDSNKQFSAKTSIIHGLVAFLVICYAQSTHVSLSILTPGDIHSIGSSRNHNVSNVAYYNGDMPFMEKQHLKYAIPAIIFTITFTFIPPLLLITYPLCYKVFELLRLQESLIVRVLCMLVPLEKLKPFFDSIQGCFKDDYRFFAGLFFIYRLLPLINYAVTDSLTLFYTLLEVQLIFTLVIHSLVQPYKQKWHNRVDILLLGLLALFNALTMYNYQNAYRDRNRFKTEINLVNAGQIFFAFLPLICLAVYGAKKVIKRITCVLCVKRKTENRNEELTDTLTMVDVRERDHTESGYHKF